MADGERLRDRGEHAFLARLCRRLRADEESGSAAHPEGGGAILIGPGDDAAVVGAIPHPLAVTTDALVEGVHFRSGWLSSRELGHRAVAVTVSDLAAMGAMPRFVVLAVTAPADVAVDDLDALIDACAAASQAAGAVLIGGNVTRSDVLSLTLTAIGAVTGPALSRGGASIGDRLVVTGNLGAAAAAVADWISGSTPPPSLRERFARPVARIAAGRLLAEAGAHAAIDVSDGLLADAGHLCEASGVGAEIDRARLPRLPEVAARDAAGADFAASGGEDYELLFACPPALCRDLPELSERAGVALTEIGTCTEAARGVILLEDGVKPRQVARAGFDHFATSGNERCTGRGNWSA